MRIKKVALKTLPYLASISIGLIFYLIGIEFQENIKGLFINISAAFFAIPLIYLFYQTVYNFSHRKLNKEIFDYAKMQIDREALSIINQLHKMVYSSKDKDFSPKGINKFLSLNKDEIAKIVSKNEYSGFQIFKEWKTSEDKLYEILKNPFILQKLEDDQIISIISMIKSLRHLEDIQKTRNLYIKIDKMASSYRTLSSKELNEEENIKFPKRHLLLKKIDKNRFKVEDFGDFSLYNMGKVLQVFRINEKYLQTFVEAINDLIEEINNWLNLTGRDFVIDTKMFRLPNRF